MNRERPRYIEPHDALDEHGRPDDAQPHSEDCWKTGCVDCREERMLRGLDVPALPVPEYIRDRQSYDEEAWRVGEGSFEEHFHHVVRPEREAS